VADKLSWKDGQKLGKQKPVREPACSTQEVVSSSVHVDPFESNYQYGACCLVVQILSERGGGSRERQSSDDSTMIDLQG